MVPNRASFLKRAWFIGPISAYRICFVVLSAVCCFSHIIVAGEYYQSFLSSIDTNRLAMAIKSPELIDTNNINSKLTNSVLSLSRAITNRQVTDIRLGMTMEEIVTVWGRPRFMWSRCYGGPRFVYSDADVIFEPGSNSVMRIIIRKLPHLEGDLSTLSTVEDCIRVLGQPTSRTANHEWGFADLNYATSQSLLVMHFGDGDLSNIFLERPGLRPTPKE